MQFIGQAIRAILKAGLSLFPKNPRKVIFESHSDFCDNSRALYEYTEHAGLNLTSVWCVKNPAAFASISNKRHIFINPRDKKTLLRWLFHVATAKTIFYSHIKPPFCNTKRQTVVCLWHGIPLKKISLQNDTPQNAFTHLTSSGQFYETVMKSCFGAHSSAFVTTGFPRNDLLFTASDALKRLNISKASYKSVLLWLPTFRQHKESGFSDVEATPTGLPLATNKAALLAMQSVLEKNNQLVILKPHPAQDLSFLNVGNFNNLIVLQNDALDKAGVLLYQLLSEVDALLTDYSSVYFDYLLKDNQIGFILDDMDAYIKNRGFVTDDPLSLMPGAHIKTMDELFAFLSSVSSGDDPYKAARNDVCNRMFSYRDGNASLRIAKLFLGAGV